MTPLRTQRACEIRATLLRAAEIALDPWQSGEREGPLTVIWLATGDDNCTISHSTVVRSYLDSVEWCYYDRQRNCWALLFAAAAVED